MLGPIKIVSEDYINEDEINAHAVRCIIHHIKEEKTYLPEILARALEITKIALNCFSPAKEVSELVNILSEVVSRNPIAIELRQELDKEIEITITALKSKLVFPKEERKTQIPLLEFALRQFEKLRPSQKSELKHIKELLPIANKYHLVEGEEFEKLTLLFSSMTDKENIFVLPRPEVRTSPSQEIMLDTSPGEDLVPFLKSFFTKEKVPLREEDFFEMSMKPQELALYEKFMNEKEDLKKRQISKITLNIIKLLKCYDPSLLYGKAGLFEEINTNKLHVLLPNFAEKLFFPAPRKINNQDKRFIGLILREATLFIKGLKDMKAHYESENIDPQLIDIKIHSLIENIQEIMSGGSPFKAVPSVFEIGFKFLSALASYRTVALLFSPLYVLTLLDRLASWPFDIDTLEKKQPPLDAFEVADRDFANSLGKQIVNLAKTFLHLSKTSALLSILLPLISTEQIGDKIYKFMQRMLNSPCSMKPLLLVSHLCINNDKPVFPPSSPPKDPIDDKLHTLLLPLIKDFIKEKSKALSYLEERLDQVEPLLSLSLAELRKIVEDEAKLKLLSYHLLKAVYEYLKN